ncbi:MAG: hypothetical protein A3B74_01385 [Candidatus Kerfeldbacteria bacterium RIFCSPHIGHO2_02_FULL_42_14]|uniref:Uncharacterized protein n=1 Tax=Candidatus Kerfeldbacteria bacterium RIFCSPHIGHO2_02_FULL_42_14 TaxID=1798540 RepID=A0A1G2AQD2_9BACT|nr:MAG: hypothetical protein A3B74_01385 [Candidatus Kerfeldbacteria bacterium RIFCSPHIGHO2_02_FULL_42_14]OGY81212.1 MAG: hypothetical protein A3E60_02900 [Candidatus Kerfeldbacteria bacterium RIFCSPHIGHO2_12_FULL_42_13]OGY83368.1 MAG: hypothetical protein A3I91_01810 [Candidatus Kerfeldbacteria bacterium RIFCSPLOWO2_02_FULL_42_19]OGY86370.1 MAG: hypothetical protein A3G01_05230 [Candidatus Kerfeldbacteria bacterium RIFCSPLOWO2_12_FULL_43_9]
MNSKFARSRIGFAGGLACFTEILLFFTIFDLKGVAIGMFFGSLGMLGLAMLILSFPIPTEESFKNKPVFTEDNETDSPWE